MRMNDDLEKCHWRCERTGSKNTHSSTAVGKDLTLQEQEETTELRTKSKALLIYLWTVFGRLRQGVPLFSLLTFRTKCLLDWLYEQDRDTEINREGLRVNSELLGWEFYPIVSSSMTWKDNEWNPIGRCRVYSSPQKGLRFFQTVAVLKRQV